MMKFMQSEVMKKAHSFFRGYTRQWQGFDFNNWSDCLKRAWQVVKENTAKAIKDAELKSNDVDMSYMHSKEYMSETSESFNYKFYHLSGDNSYKGD